MGFRGLALAAALTAGLQVALPAQAAATPWCETSTDQFQLISDLERELQHELLEKLERFELLAAPFLPGDPVSRRDPLKLVVFKHRKDFLAMTGKRQFAGYMQPSLQSNRLLIGPIRGDLVETTLHEYAHYLLRNRGGVSLPMWFDEGLATLLGATQLREDTAVVGALPVGRLERRISAEEELLSPQQRVTRALDTSSLEGWRSARISEFYDLSWLLVHYLYFNVYPAELAAGEIPTSELTDFLKAGDQALTDHLGMRSSQLLRAVERHLSRWGRPEPIPAPEVQLTDTRFRCLDHFERDMAVARAIHSQNPDAASKLLAPYAEAAATEALPATEEMSLERLVDLKVTLARIEMASDSPETAGALVASALALDADHPETIILGADLLVSDCLFERSQACLDRWQQASARYRTAVRSDPTRYDAILGLGLAELHRGRAGDAVNYLKVAYARAPWAAVINYYLGESYRLMGDSRARTYLENARSWAVQDIWRLMAEESLRLIDSTG